MSQKLSEKFPLKSIVRIDPNLSIHASGHQGMVVGHQPKDKDGSTVLVWVGHEADFLIDYPQRNELTSVTAVLPPSEGDAKKDPRTYAYRESELRIEPAWTIHTLAERYFKGSYHTWYELKDPAMPLHPECQVEGCTHPATQRILINIWGSVMSVDVCGTCGPKYHGKCIEMFPWKKETPKVKALAG